MQSISMRRIAGLAVLCSALVLLLSSACDRAGRALVDAGRALQDAGDGMVSDAHAQPAPCSRWRIVELDTGVSDSPFDLIDFTLPEGHEPLEMDYGWFGSSDVNRRTIIARTCAD
jgi:hypothetical protein